LAFVFALNAGYNKLWKQGSQIDFILLNSCLRIAYIQCDVESNRGFLTEKTQVG